VHERVEQLLRGRPVGHVLAQRRLDDLDELRVEALQIGLAVDDPVHHGLGGLAERLAAGAGERHHGAPGEDVGGRCDRLTA